MTKEQLMRLRGWLDDARRRHEDGSLDGNDAWEWYANDGVTMMDALEEVLTALEKPA